MKVSIFSVHVIVEDENDNKPLFNKSTYSLNVMENTTVGTTLLRATATDNDVSYNGDVIYSIIGDGTKFDINSSTGKDKKSHVHMSKTFRLFLISMSQKVLFLIQHSIPVGLFQVYSERFQFHFRNYHSNIQAGS